MRHAVNSPWAVMIHFRYASSISILALNHDTQERRAPCTDLAMVGPWWFVRFALSTPSLRGLVGSVFLSWLLHNIVLLRYPSWVDEGSPEISDPYKRYQCVEYDFLPVLKWMRLDLTEKHLRAIGKKCNETHDSWQCKASQCRLHHRANYRSNDRFSVIPQAFKIYFSILKR